jgi:hypothetical protein
LIDNPNFVPPAAGQQATQPQEIPNPGIAISLVAEANLQALVFWAKHREHISRPATPVLIMVAAIDELQVLREQERNYQGSTDKPVINHDNWFKINAALVEYLSQYLGCTKVPLAYVISEVVAVPTIHRRTTLRTATR